MGGFNWSDLVAAYLQWDAANKASDKKPNYSISPQMQWLFDNMKDMVKYSPTRDYISTYSDSFLKQMNSPDGALNWKPTFQSDYMKGQQPLPSMGIDMTKAPIFQGDKNGKMPWNFGYTGPGLGGKPTTGAGGGSGPVGPNGNPIGGRSGVGLRGGMQKDQGEWEGFNAITGGASQYDQISNDYGWRNGYGLLIDNSNANSPQAQQQWNQWFGGLTREQRRLELERSKQLNNYIKSIGGAAGGAIWTAIKEDPLGFVASIATAGATGGLSLIGFLTQKGVDKVAGNAWSGIKDWFSKTFGGGGSTPPPNNNNAPRPGGAV